MNAGVTVVLGIVGALVLCEMVFPRVFAALRHWRGKQRAKNAPVVADGGQRTEDKEQRTEIEPDAGQPPPDAVPPPPDAVPPLSDAVPPPPETGQDEAERLWGESQKMSHGILPDPETDGDYLATVYAAARLGHLKALAKLGDYAYRRGAIVEAFYWTILAQLKGAVRLDKALCEIRTRWLAEGCPSESENVYAEFTEEQGEFARTVLLLECDVNPQYAAIRLDELADAGNEAARLYVQAQERRGES